jgi:hypothetical protein
MKKAHYETPRSSHYTVLIEEGFLQFTYNGNGLQQGQTVDSDWDGWDDEN